LAQYWIDEYSQFDSISHRVGLFIRKLTGRNMEFDYVIVGAGSAGCVLAGRLSEDPAISVCLLEAGPPDKSPFIHMPSGFAALLPSKKYNWVFETVPQKSLNNRNGFQPRGKTLGGSSSINAMVYIRGHAKDYDEWAELGNVGWSYNDVLPYFKKSQHQERGADVHHGTDGPLNVSDLQEPHSATRTFCQAAEEMQLPITDDFNGEQQEGVGIYQTTILNGQRCSAARAFLTPHLDRPNLTVFTRAHASKILFEGKKAVGIAYIHKGKQEKVIAKKEVLLSGGAFNSPQLLMLSGVGAENELRGHNIEPVHHLPGVGENLQDHIDFVISHTSKDKELLGFSLAAFPRLIKGLYQYITKNKGILTSNVAEGGGFLKTSPSLERPDIQLHFGPALVDDHGRKVHTEHGFSCHVCLLRPKSKGTLKLASNDPFEDPLIDPNFLAEDDDMNVLVKGVKLTDQLLRAPAFAKYASSLLYALNIESDEDIKEAIRERADTVYHPVGTCKMGQDEMAVVDAELRVHGLDALRVIDASIMPTLIGGNTNAPTIMIAEKAADMIMEAIAADK
jgi:choline dehydrogenase-like flavoprotein